MTPLTVSANPASKVDDGLAYSGGNGVSYSSVPNAYLLGSVSFSGDSQGAVNPGIYTITPGGLYSTQQGYIISYRDANLTISEAPLMGTDHLSSPLLRQFKMWPRRWLRHSALSIKHCRLRLFLSKSKTATWRQ